MADAYFSGKTLDDVMRMVVEEIDAHGNRIYPAKGGKDGAVELTGVLLELTNVRARLSRTETRGKPFSGLGELCWYYSLTTKIVSYCHICHLSYIIPYRSDTYLPV